MTTLAPFQTLNSYYQYVNCLTNGSQFFIVKNFCDMAIGGGATFDVNSLNRADKQNFHSIENFFGKTIVIVTDYGK